MATFSEIQKRFGAGETTIADYKNLIGKPNTVRVNGMGVRGLRWAVEKVDDKSGMVTVSCHDGREKVVETYRYTELTIVKTDKPGKSKLCGFSAG